MVLLYGLVHVMDIRVRFNRKIIKVNLKKAINFFLVRVADFYVYFADQNLVKMAILNATNSFIYQTSHLKTLDLTANGIRLIPSFSRFDSLTELTLDHNPIFELKENSFYGLNQLKSLMLNSCEISKMEDHAFNGLIKLKMLFLTRNPISNSLQQYTRKEFVFKYISKDFVYSDFRLIWF